MKVAIIGSGPAGLSAAYELSKHGAAVDVYEKDKTPGGLAKSIELWGQKIELGPHFLKKQLDEPVEQLLLSVLADKDIIYYNRLTRIYINDQFFQYPPSAKDFMLKLGIFNTVKAGASFASAKLNKANSDGSVELFIKNKLGNYLYKNFFKEYTEKLWGRDCNTIDDSYAKGMIGFGKLNILEFAKKYFSKSNTSLYQKCMYPVGGMSMIWSKLQLAAEKQGAVFLFNANIQHITFNNASCTVQLNNETCNSYNYIISTVNEMVLLKMMQGADERIIKNLYNTEFRSVIAAFLEVEPCNFLEDNCVYLYSKKIKATRITNYNRFRNKPGNHILMIEYWTSEKDILLSSTDKELLTVVKNDLLQMPKGNTVKIVNLKTIRLKNAYPVPLKNSIEARQQAADYLKSFKGLILAGRSNQNNFNYGMEEALADGIAKANQIILQ